MFYRSILVLQQFIVYILSGHFVHYHCSNIQLWRQANVVFGTLLFLVLYGSLVLTCCTHLNVSKQTSVCLHEKQYQSPTEHMYRALIASTSIPLYFFYFLCYTDVIRFVPPSLPPSLPPSPQKKGCFLLSIDILIVCTSLYIYSQCFNICDSIFCVFLCFNYSKKQQHYVACLVMKSNYMLLTSLVCLAIYIMSTVSDNLGSLFFISRCLRPVCIF